MGRRPKTHQITHSLLNQTIRVLNHAIPRRDGGCPECGSERFMPCYQGCAVSEAVRIVAALRATKQG